MSSENSINNSEKPSKHLTLKEIAAKTGVHYTTVARALKNSPLLKKETRLRIQRVAEEMGYCPDPMMQALVRYRHEVNPRRHAIPIAYLSHDEGAFAGDASSFGAVPYLDGAKKQAERLGFRLEYFWHAKQGITDRRWSQIFLARNIRIIITANFPSRLRDVELDWSEFSAVKISVNPAYPPLDTVSCNQMQTVRKAIQVLRERGFKRIGMLYDQSTDDRLGNLWTAGYLVESQNMSERDRIPPLEVSNCSEPGQIVDLVRHHRLDAVVSYVAVHLEMLRAGGLRVPEDISYASLNVDYSEPHEVAGMRQSYAQVGAAAVNLVTKLYESNTRGFPELPSIQYIESVWTDGPTVAPSR